MYELSLKDFRGFHSTDYVRVRPITILIGENSAGKSSFLAGLKYALDFISGDEEPSFNKDPFQLGTFQQISHYRGGKAGRAREFKIRLRTTLSINRRNRSADGVVTFEVAFTNTDSQAAIHNISVSANKESLVARLDGDRVSLSFISRSGESYSLSKSDTFPRVLRTEFARYWPFFLRELRFRMQKSVASEETLLTPDIDARAALLGEFAEALSRQLRGRIEATSAIRTKPLRTYTPGTEARDGEGSHVPFEMAKLYRGRNKDAWRNLKASIESFGQTSEMFRDVNIKAFGNSVSDPFQLQFSSDGPKTNIVDLGYGTSQVLPILYDVSAALRGTKFLIQQPEVHLHPRAQAALGSYFVDAFLRDKKHFILETHSDFIVDRVRKAVADGRITADDVSILFFERKRLENSITTIDLDSAGTPIDPPNTYRSFFIDEQMKVLGL